MSEGGPDKSSSRRLCACAHATRPCTSCAMTDDLAALLCASDADLSEDDAAAKPGGATQSEEREEGEVSDAAPTAPCDEALATARAIAKRLREKKVHLIHALVQHFGGDTAQEALKETLQVEAGGGMTTRDGSRRRDAGGVFLELFARRVNKTELNRVQRNAQKAWVRRGEKALPSKRLQAPDEEDEGQTGRRRRGAAADSGDVL